MKGKFFNHIPSRSGHKVPNVYLMVFKRPSDFIRENMLAPVMSIHSWEILLLVMRQYGACFSLATATVEALCRRCCWPSCPT
mmetsp:Transcript_4423/g.10238  ORF Transcript_4423/g.10238 Transcript_4423/m.10238 type:complete len:82 (-) Transcript_4423:1012-1257(-)